MRWTPAIPVIRFDAPGVGGSPRTRTFYRFPALARRLGRVLDDLGCKQVDVLGISWGGGLAQQFALTPAASLPPPGTGRDRYRIDHGPGQPAGASRHMVTPRSLPRPRYLRGVANELYGGTATPPPRPPSKG